MFLTVVTNKLLYQSNYTKQLCFYIIFIPSPQQFIHTKAEEKGEKDLFALKRISLCAAARRKRCLIRDKMLTISSIVTKSLSVECLWVASQSVSKFFWSSSPLFANGCCRRGGFLCARRSTSCHGYCGWGLCQQQQQPAAHKSGKMRKKYTHTLFHPLGLI